MWLLGTRNKAASVDDDDNDHRSSPRYNSSSKRSTTATSSASKKSTSRNRRRRWGVSSRRNQSASSSSSTISRRRRRLGGVVKGCRSLSISTGGGGVSTTIAEEEQRDNGGGEYSNSTETETYAGIEVSLSSHSQEMGSKNSNGPISPLQGPSFVPAMNYMNFKNTNNSVFNVKKYRLEMQRVYQNQFSCIPTAYSSPNRKQNQLKEGSLKDRALLKATTDLTTTTSSSLSPLALHRVPTFRKKKKDHQSKKAAAGGGGGLSSSSYKRAFRILQSRPVQDERRTVKREIALLEQELGNIQFDRQRLEAPFRFEVFLVGDGTEPASTAAAPNSNKTSSRRSDNDRTAFQERRGLYLTVHLSDALALQTLQSKCGMTKKQKQQPKQQRRGRKQQQVPHDDLCCIGPHNCRQGGAAATIQHVKLLPRSNFWISRDNNTSYNAKSTYVFGTIPIFLQRRCRSSSSSSSLDVKHLVDLVVCPLGISYYAQFRNGSCVWYTNDIVLDNLFQTVNVRLVAFGENSSWLLMDQQGKVCWKNLPASLHKRLSKNKTNKDSVALASVELGPKGCYFVRFVDGTYDWQLPAKLADICHKLIADGREITSVSMLEQDFIVRHR